MCVEAFMYGSFGRCNRNIALIKMNVLLVRFPDAHVTRIHATRFPESAASVTCVYLE